MLHPGLGSSPDPLTAWQIDTQDVTDVITLYNRQLLDTKDPEQHSRRLALLWKKLASTPRLARLIVGYAQMQAQRRPIVARRSPRFTEQVLANFGWAPSRQAATPRPTIVEDDPLYDRWIDI